MSTGETAVKRYRLEQCEEKVYHHSLIGGSDGNFVSVEDYTALERRVQELEQWLVFACRYLDIFVTCFSDGSYVAKGYGELAGFGPKYDHLKSLLPAPPDAGGTR